MHDDAAVAAWRPVLDDLTERLMATVEDVRAGREPGDDWHPPAGLPPLPERLRAEAEQLLDAQQELTRHLAALRDDARSKLTTARSAQRFAAPGRTKQAAARYVDLDA
ncbi:hypothetical protein [Aeromicrobium sp. IC_218]|uniref:hypothetical protein n=1 Tax=Aeromicrobium sp. IC_218 TaxID=2545468 RepID=UPI00103CB85D|nr:hypothetical protein [Aeromicrobium sp. IC_218]TCJ00531.1 hypothetical protein E0W78_00060 [Aeromicrobium sp. IC_218]